MKISITIMAHPKRRKQAEKLLVQLAGQPFIHRYITWDQANNEWDTGSRALMAGIGTGADYHIVLQDDAILPPNFYDHVHEALSNVPLRSLVSLYTGTVRPIQSRIVPAVEKARKSKASWLKSDLLYWGVGIAMPVSHIEHVLEFVADRTEVYDFRIGWAYMRQRIPVFYTNPSLVDHDNDLGSILKQSALVPVSEYEKLPRRAHNFVGNEKPAWNSRVIDI